MLNRHSLPSPLNSHSIPREYFFFFSHFYFLPSASSSPFLYISAFPFFPSYFPSYYFPFFLLISPSAAIVSVRLQHSAWFLKGTFPVEQGDIHKRWKLVSTRLKDFHKCIVLPIGSLSIGLCRHRAILFKVFLQMPSAEDTIWE